MAQRIHIEWLINQGENLPDEYFYGYKLVLSAGNNQTKIEDRQNAELFRRIFNENDPRYSRELVVAIKAWDAVTTGGKGSPRKALDKWINANHDYLTDKAKDRIATMINWKPGGGASSADEEKT